MQVALRCSTSLPRAERAIITAGFVQGTIWRNAVAAPAGYWPRAPRGSSSVPRASPSTPPDGVDEHAESPQHRHPEAIVGRVMAAQANFVRIKVEQTGEGRPFPPSSPPPQTRLLCVVRALLKKMKRQVLVGDMVRVVGIDWVDGRGMVEEVFPRTSKLDEPPVANISRVMLVFSLAMPPFMPSAATRYLVSAEHTGLPVTVVLNKCDLLSEEEVRREVQRLEAWGYDCVAASVREGHEAGLEALESRLKGDVTVVAGPSGAGKSSIINALSVRGIMAESSLSSSAENRAENSAENNGVDLQAVGDVSERVGRGKHTTRNVTIVELAGGGAMVDTPGFNQPTLSFPPTDLERCFPEIRKRLERLDEHGNRQTCAFKNCRHLSEPGCIVTIGDVSGSATGSAATENPSNEDPFERYPYYVELLSELQATADHLAKRAIAKRRREGTTRRKTSAGGVDRVEARLDTKSHRRTSRRSVRQEISVLNPEDAEDYDGRLL